jgi:uncharacterized protein (TIGR03437 family)
VIQGFTIQNGKLSGINVSNSSPSILSNRIVNNKGCEGGGIFISFGSPLIQFNTIGNNAAGQGCAGRGGGGILIGGDSQTQILDNVITGNTANGDGGAILNWAGGAALVRHNVITGNTASQGGGGMASVNAAAMTIVGNLIAGNKAVSAGAMFFSSPPAAIVNNTVVGNQSTSTSTAATPVSGLQTNLNSTTRIVGNLIIAYPGQIALACGSYSTQPLVGIFKNNDVFSEGGTAYAAACVDQTGSNNNVSVDPRFLNPTGGNYRLQTKSPVINAGDPTAGELIATDLDGNPRLRNGRVDMGAYEYPGPATASLSARNLEFPSRPIGESSAVQPLTIRNEGPAPFQIGSVVVQGDFSYTTTCPAGGGLAAAETCIVAVTFTPTNRGSRSGSLVITSNASNSPWTIVLSGTAVGAVATLSTATVAFPNQTVNQDSAPASVTLSNTGDYPLTVVGISTSAEFSQTNTCSGTIAPSGSCSIAVTFRPIASGTRTGTLTIRSNAVGSPHVFNLTGNGLALAPVLTGLSATSSLSYSGAFNLTLRGENFVANSVVRWNGADRPTTYTSPSQLIAAIPATDLTNGGIFPVTIFNPLPGGGTSNPISFTVNNGTPTATSISPTSALVGNSSFQLTVNGSGFVAASVVRWNGNDRPTTFINPTQLRAAIAAADISLASTNQISIFNPAPGGGVSNALTFTAVVPTPQPSVVSISPASATAGDPAFTLTVNGAGFVPSSLVLWRGSPRPTTYLSDVQLQAAIGAGDIASGGTFGVAVVNPSPGGGTSAASPFSVIGSPLPALSSVTPSTVSGGGAAFTLAVNGSGFSVQSTVRWNGADRPTTFVSVNQLTAAIAVADIAAAGAASVTVFNPPPGGGVSQTLNITITSNPPPVVTGLLPTSLVAGTAGQAVRIQGSGFTTSSVVRWNGQDRKPTLVDSNTLSILLTDRDLAVPGLAEIRVFNAPPGGGSSTPWSFAVAVGVAANGIAFDKNRGLLWVSVPSSQARYGNSVVSIDPMTGALGQPIFVGSEPGKLVISDDGQYLYVALNSAAAIRRVDLVAQQADLQFSLGGDGFFGSMYPEDMAVMPGNSRVIAVSRRYPGVSPRHAGVAVFDDGVIRKNTTQVHTGSDRIEWSASPGIVYGYNNETTEFGFRILTVDENGIQESKNYGSSPIGGFNSDIKFEGGRIYATSGAVLNPGTGTLFGRFTFPNSSTASAVAPDAALGRTSFIYGGSFSSNAPTFAVYDNSTFTPIGSVIVPGLANVGNGDDGMVRWGEDGLAIRGQGQVFLLRSSMVKPPAFSAESIVNAASYAAGPAAPGSLATIFGQAMTPLALGATGTPLPDSLAGIAVMVNGTAAPLFFASPGQINFQLPWNLVDKNEAELAVSAPGFAEKAVKIAIASYAPGLFTTGAPDGQGIVAIAGTATFAAPAGTLPGARPANRGEYVTIYCNGLGAVSSPPSTGAVSPSDPLARTIAQPAVTIGGQSADVSFSGLAPGLVGVYQINAQVPASSATGDAVPIVVAIGGARSNVATIAVR